jgi:dTMP kinase
MKYYVSFDIDLRRNPHKGQYIALEGVDGSGKTTQAERLARYFKSQGKEAIVTREPRKEGIVGDIVQQVLTGKLKMPSVGLQYLFSTDRVIHHAEIIEPALKAGKVVVSDRCLWSAVVYGVLDKALSYGKEAADILLASQSILSMYHQFIVPDYTFLLKVSLDSAFERISKKDDTKEIYEDKEKIKKVIEGYDWLSKEFSNEIKVIDGEKSIEEVTAEMVSAINK